MYSKTPNRFTSPDYVDALTVEAVANARRVAAALAAHDAELAKRARLLRLAAFLCDAAIVCGGVALFLIFTN